MVVDFVPVSVPASSEASASMTVDIPRGMARKDKRHGGWEAEFHWRARGIRKRWHAPSRREAVAKMEAYRHELGDGLDPQDVTFNQLADRYVAGLKRTRKPSTVEFATWCLSHARSRIGYKHVAEVTPSDIEAIMHAAMDAGLGTRSVRGVRQQVNAVMKRAVRDRLVVGNPVASIEAPQQPTRRLDLPDIEDVHALLDEMKDADHPSWPALHVIAASGLRVSEARSLRWSDIDEAAEVLHVRGQLDRAGNWSSPKTKAGVRTVPLTPRARLALAEARRRQDGAKVSSVYVFATRDGNPPAAWTLTRAWTRNQERRWGKVRLTTHGLRHLVLSSLVAAGLPVTDVAKLAGHASSSVVTTTYAHALSGHEQRAREALEAGVG